MSDYCFNINHIKRCLQNRVDSFKNEEIPPRIQDRLAEDTLLDVFDLDTGNATPKSLVQSLLFFVKEIENAFCAISRELDIADTKDFEKDCVAKIKSMKREIDTLKKEDGQKRLYALFSRDYHVFSKGNLYRVKQMCFTSDDSLNYVTIADHGIDVDVPMRDVELIRI